MIKRILNIFQRIIYKQNQVIPISNKLIKELNPLHGCGYKYVYYTDNELNDLKNTKSSLKVNNLFFFK